MMESPAPSPVIVQQDAPEAPNAPVPMGQPKGSRPGRSPRSTFLGRRRMGQGMGEGMGGQRPPGATLLGQ